MLKNTHQDTKIALVLQGGGALGAYHIGAYQALLEQGIQPDWISGISIGAINSAVLAGSQPHERLTNLESLWQNISYPRMMPQAFYNALPLPFKRNTNQFSNWLALTFGQPNFFNPRFFNPLMFPQVETTHASFYDTTPMEDTLNRMLDFELLNNSDQVKLSLGATNLETGQMEFFNNWEREITAKHVMASGSLPPGFPAVEIDGKFYWDGGCVSNTPLQAVLDNEPSSRLLVFMVDLWSASGRAPTNMDEVNWRQKEIQYASRTPKDIQQVIQDVNLCRGLCDSGAQDHIPEQLSHYLKYEQLDIVHITYDPDPDQISNSDAEFSKHSIVQRREEGLRDMRAALEFTPWGSVSRAPKRAAQHKVKRGFVYNVDVKGQENQQAKVQDHHAA